MNCADDGSGTGQRYMCCQAREEDSSGLRDERLNPYHEEKYQMFQV